MSSELFRIDEHVVDASHIRGFPRATSTTQEEVLQLSVKHYTPLDNTNPSPGDLTIVAAHANGFPKVQKHFTVPFMPIDTPPLSNHLSICPLQMAPHKIGHVDRISLMATFYVTWPEKVQMIVLRNVVTDYQVGALRAALGRAFEAI
jgi:hypothetical protein